MSQFKLTVPDGAAWTPERIAAFEAEWNRTMATTVPARLVPVSDDETSVSILILPKDEFSLIVLRDGCVSCDAIDGLAKAIRSSGVRCALVESYDCCVEAMPKEQSIAFLRTIAVAMSDGDLAAIGLRRGPKPDILDITRSFA